MKILFLSVVTLLVTAALQAQLTVPADGGNKKASVSERIGITDVTIHYDRPAVRGRQGQIWGKVVHEGFADLGFGTSKAAPWRAGANENTTIEFSTDVTVEGLKVKAGKYGLFLAYNAGGSTLILSTAHTAWGSYFYEEKDDALRVKIKSQPLSLMVERLQFQFTGQMENSAIVELQWENLSFPFTVAVDIQQTQLASFRKELVGEKSFNPGWQSWNQAASWCLERKLNLEEALRWANMAVSGVFIGEANFTTLSTKAGILDLLGRKAEADSAMKAALPLGKMLEVHNYARRLLQQKRNADAFAIFKMNYDKNPGEYTTNMGMARGFAALGNTKKALEHAQKALALAPDATNKAGVEGMIEKLKAGKEINQ